MNDSRHLMERAENALRTGQTANLFPLYYRRAVEQIAVEKAENRRQWAATGPAGAAQVAEIRAAEAVEAVIGIVSEAWATMRAAVQPALDYLTSIADLLEPEPPRPIRPETPKERELRLRTDQMAMRNTFQHARHTIHPLTIRSNLK